MEGTMKAHSCLLVFLLLLLLLLGPLAVDAAVITVRGDGTGDYTLIGPAVSASAPGDSIEIGPGTYYDSAVVEVGHSLTFYSTDGAAATILDGQGTHRVMRVAGLGVTVDISGLTFSHGFIADNVGGGLVATEDAVVTVRDCVFDANEAGGMGMAQRAQATLQQCVFTNNTGTTGTGGIYIAGDPPENGTHADIIDCEFRGNNAGKEGGGISVVEEATATVFRCSFYDNIGPINGGGIFCSYFSEVDVIQCFFKGNTAEEGSAIRLLYPWGGRTVTQNTFHENVSSLNVDGPYGTIVITGSSYKEVTNNIFSGEIGGYGMAFASGNAIHECNVYYGNEYGAIEGVGLDPTEQVADPMFCNAAGDDFTVHRDGPASPAGSLCGDLIGVFPVGCPAAGDVIKVREDGTGDYKLVGLAVLGSAPGDSIEIGPGTYYETALIDVTHSLTFFSTHGAAATILDGEGVRRIMRVRGLGVTVDISGLTFAHGFIAANVGGGLVATEDPVISIRDCVFNANEAGGLVLARRAQATVERCVFRNNTGATGTGGVYVTGAVPPPLVDNTRADIIECEFRDNDAGEEGGGVAVVNGASASIVHTSFYDNVGPLFGGGIFSGADATVDVSKCFFKGNTAELGSAIYYYQSTGSVTRNTFYENVSSLLVAGPYGTVAVHSESDLTVTGSIFSNEIGGYGLVLPDDSITHECNVYYSNQHGAIVGDGISPTEQIADPEFCDTTMGDYTVQADGPASPEGSLCGEGIGAFPVGCSPPTAIRSTTGAAFGLSQNVPNPFNPRTRIAYVLAEPTEVSLEIFDVSGRHVRTIVRGRETAGRKLVTWDGRDNRGDQVASGVYFYRLRAASYVETRKAVFLK